MVIQYIAAGLALGAVAERYGIPMPTTTLKGELTPDDGGVESEAASRVRSVLELREGYRNNAYNDTRGILTVGIGHKVVAKDNIKLGQYIKNDRVEEFYKADVATAFKAAVSQAKELGKYNADMIVALTEVNFQLGTYWRIKFANTWSLLKTGTPASINRAISNLRVSAWYRQTPNRVNNFAEAIQRNYA